ncbi:MAG: sulfur reduction protein DsrE [Thermoproteota archaeon]|nr:MAG: sulfur reduction protein DsrE [Candidatus Korarchaeota archaeon]
MSSLLVVLTKPPYGREDALGAAYTALACAEKGISSTLLLVGDGVYAAMRGQRPQGPSIEDLLYASYPDVKLLVDGKSMEERGIRRDELVEHAKVADQKEIAKAAMEASWVLVF